MRNIALWLAIACMQATALTRVSSVTVNSNSTITVQVSKPATGAGTLTVFELQPYDDPAIPGAFVVSAGNNASGTQSISIPRMVGSADRIYTAFKVRYVNGGTTEWSDRYFVDVFNNSMQNSDAFPVPCSKKGLTGIWYDVSGPGFIRDLNLLSPRHTTKNIWINELTSSQPMSTPYTLAVDGATYYFQQGVVEDLDAMVMQCNQRGILVYVLINIEPSLGSHESTDILKDPIVHPKTAWPAAGAFIPAINTTNQAGTRKFKATMEFLAQRYSRPKTDPGYRGNVYGYSPGNEVDLHWIWYNMGFATPAAVIEDYGRTLRIAVTAVRKYVKNGRVYASLAHYWSVRGEPGVYSGDQTMVGKDLVAGLDAQSSAGNYAWHLNHHPYPLLHPDAYNDPLENSSNAQLITFRNLHVLRNYLAANHLYNGAPRRIILGEQGILTDPPWDAFVQRRQMASYAYAYHKVAHMSGVDAFIYYKYRDGGDGTLGLQSSPENGDFRKMVYNLFGVADSPLWRGHFGSALGIMQNDGRPDLFDWNAVLEGTPSQGYSSCPDALLMSIAAFD